MPFDGWVPPLELAYGLRWADVTFQMNANSGMSSLEWF
jgi:hypothetical protein